MPGKTLTKQQVQSLLLGERTPQVGTWPNKADRKLLYEAASNKRKRVTFTNGQEFTLTYAIHHSIAWKKYDVVFVKPIEGKFIPCGWFHIKFLLVDE